jgi:hypothetical protein
MCPDILNTLRQLGLILVSTSQSIQYPHPSGSSQLTALPCMSVSDKGLSLYTVRRLDDRFTTRRLRTLSTSSPFTHLLRSFVWSHSTRSTSRKSSDVWVSLIPQLAGLGFRGLELADLILAEERLSAACGRGALFDAALIYLTLRII